MALINCPECEKNVSNKAHSCPNCGYPVKEQNKFKLTITGYNYSDTSAMADLNTLLQYSWDDAENIVNSLPCVIAESTNRSEVEELAYKLKNSNLEYTFADQENNELFPTLQVKPASIISQQLKNIEYFTQSSAKTLRTFFIIFVINFALTIISFLIL